MNSSTYFESIRSNVLDSGRHTVGVLGDGAKDPTYFYSVGNSLTSTPSIELVCFYFTRFGALLLGEVASWLSEDPNRIEEILSKGVSYVPGFLGEEGVVPIALKHLTGLQARIVREKYVLNLQAEAISDLVKPHELIQIVLPDLNGFFPGDPNCSPDANEAVPEFLRFLP